MKEKNRYNAWKTDSNLNPIEGTDRILTANSKRAVVRHLSYEEGVEYVYSSMIVRCKDGTLWCVSKI